MWELFSNKYSPSTGKAAWPWVGRSMICKNSQSGSMYSLVISLRIWNNSENSREMKWPMNENHILSVITWLYWPAILWFVLRITGPTACWSSNRQVATISTWIIFLTSSWKIHIYSSVSFFFQHDRKRDKHYHFKSAQEWSKNEFKNAHHHSVYGQGPANYPAASSKLVAQSKFLSA